MAGDDAANVGLDCLLAIESSCDETAAAVVCGRGQVLSNVISSQVDVHAVFGGVVPELASRHHVVNILPVIRQALAEARERRPGLSFPQDLSAVAVTAGPGLVGSLMVGLQVAKALSWAWQRPLVAVNHLEAHLEAAYAWRQEPGPMPPVPHVGLLVSGGHSLLLFVRQRGAYELLGTTRDDAAGEAFDKVAKMLGLPYPGGPVIARLAQGGDPNRFRFPRALPRRDELDMSFSGLKTAVRLHLQEHGRPSKEADLSDLCASVQEAIVDALCRKALAALRLTGSRDLVVVGGVAANGRLRERLREEVAALGGRVWLPALEFCTDNAAMVGVAGLRLLSEGRTSGLETDARARWLPFSQAAGGSRG